MLFVGTVMGFGFLLLHIYTFCYNLQHPDAPIKALSDYHISTVTQATNGEPTVISVLINILMVIFIIALFYIIARLYNRQIRSILRRLSNLFRLNIFTMELLCTAIAWTITALLVTISFPSLGIFAVIAFVINELLFIFAWEAYGQPKYKI